MSIAEELQRLADLKEQGAITESEFEAAKAELLTHSQHNPSMPNVSSNQWAMLLHLSQYAGFIVPFAGFVCPILIWQLKKDDVPGLDEHGKNVANWIVSAAIYTVISALLTVIVIGLLGMAAVAIMALVFPLIGGLKANDGVAWKYPTAIGFFK
jgi:uncharacterized Tic20 family protein